MFLTALLFASATFVSPSDPRIVYVGRFDWSDRTAPACEWSGTEVRLRIRGESVVTEIEAENPTRLEIVVDGSPNQVLSLVKGKAQYTIDVGGNGEHELSLVRREEAFMGVVKFDGFDAPNGELLRARTRRRHIEFIGDSITCAYGNEGKDQHDRFRPETENAYMSYASIAARLVNADVSIIAWSGRKMWPNNTTPEIYDSVLPTKSSSQYDFNGPAPDAIVINLATNDFGKIPPDEVQWTAAYEAFIKRLWGHYPTAQIYAATGPMMFGESLALLKTYMQKIRADIDDPRLHLIDFPVQQPENGYGADWHPSVKTDEMMGEQLAEALRHDLRW